MLCPLPRPSIFSPSQHPHNTCAQAQLLPSLKCSFKGSFSDPHPPSCTRSLVQRLFRTTTCRRDIYSHTDHTLTLTLRSHLYPQPLSAFFPNTFTCHFVPLNLNLFPSSFLTVFQKNISAAPPSSDPTLPDCSPLCPPPSSHVDPGPALTGAPTRGSFITVFLLQLSVNIFLSFQLN